MTNLFYRGYTIERLDEVYIAKPTHDDGHPFELFSTQIRRVLEAINALWLTASQLSGCEFETDHLISPRWARDWLKSPTDSVDLDQAYRRGAC
ncbi:hypothetical protein ABIB80_000246 [Bradyrhizobium sp. i1.15.2]|uniref:hypothetical protein n=1 Tax=Bradyrhizobium sp. i1.15.2 TaxID=3156362 RepID=UPI003397A0AC